MSATTMEEYAMTAIKLHLNAMIQWINAGRELRNCVAGIMPRCMAAAVCITIPWTGETVFPDISASGFAKTIFFLLGVAFFVCVGSVIGRLVTRAKFRAIAEESAAMLHRQSAVVGAADRTHEENVEFDPNYAALMVESITLYDELIFRKWMSPVEEVTT